MTREHETQVRVRYGETDKMGVVYHANYLHYFEIGRTELMRSSGLVYAEMEKKGYKFVVSEAGCNYRAAARYDEVLTIRTRVSRLGRASVRFDYVALREGAPVADGHTVLACLDADEKPARIPPEFEKKLREWRP